MRKMNKKGLSEVVATVLIIFLVIASVGIIVAAIMPLIKLAPERVSCVEIQIEEPILMEACLGKKINDGGSLDIEVTLVRDLSKLQVEKIDFSLSSESSSERIEYFCGGSCGKATILKSGELKTYYLDSKGIEWDSIIMKVNGCTVIRKEISDSC